jgi:CheY-like chemotaxis protein
VAGVTGPVLLVVDHEPRELGAFEHAQEALRRRLQGIGRALTRAALVLLERLARRGEDVALVAAELHLPAMDGVEFLERARALHTGVARALLVAMDEYHARIPFKEMETIRHATALGRIDFWVVKGWTTPEEWLYPRVQEALSAWTMANRLATWSTASSASGFRYNALKDTISLAPAQAPREFRSPFVAGSGWGTMQLEQRTGQLRVVLSCSFGEVQLRSLSLRGIDAEKATAAINGEQMTVRGVRTADASVFTFEGPILLQGDDRVELLVGQMA